MDRPIDRPVDWKVQWVLDAPTALAVIHEGATVLDTRGALAFARGHLPSAIRANWKDFSQTGPADRGKLLPRSALQKVIRAHGVNADTPVIVVGDPPDDWGEDGRIVWMLRAAGHSRAAFVSGGFDALERAGAKMTMKTTRPAVGDFRVAMQPYQAKAADMRRNDVVLLDTREAREFAGATPYGESRGGHVPGARNLHFEALMNPDGTVLGRDAIRRRLRQLGVTPETPLIAYCTGGVRSGWVVAVLTSAGFDARNYAGSMWEWSAGDPAKHPLETN